MNLVQRKFYLPQEMYTQLSVTAKVQQKTITELLREILEKGLAELHTQAQKTNTQMLLRMAKNAERKKWQGPADLATNHDTFFLLASQKI